MRDASARRRTARASQPSAGSDGEETSLEQADAGQADGTQVDGAQADALRDGSVVSAASSARSKVHFSTSHLPAPASGVLVAATATVATAATAATITTTANIAASTVTAARIPLRTLAIAHAERDTGTHPHDGVRVFDEHSYSRRGWCRLEQWARMTVNGPRRRAL